MIKEFLEKVALWALEKEEEAVKSGTIPHQEIDHQLQTLQEKRAELKRKCEEQEQELDMLITRVEKIRNIQVLKGQ